MNKPDNNLPLGPLMVDVDGPQLTEEDVDVLNHPLVGGVILFSRNYQNKHQVTELVSKIKLLRVPELLVCVDQEGGRVQRFKDGFTILPPLHTLGCLYDEDSNQALEASRMLARLMAQELRPAGIDFSFAPVLDLYHPSSQIIANRAFHHDPQITCELAKAYIMGLHDIGIIAVAKHFPGHGGVLEDSHMCLPQDPRCYEDIDKKDLLPYKKLINHGLDALMSAHVLFNQIDTLPSGFSSFWIKDILRKQLNFNGVVFTDDLSMQAAIELGTIVDRTWLALEAGCDIALICNNRTAVEQVLDNSELQSLINTKMDLAGRCRMQPRLPDWQPEANRINALLSTLAIYL